MVTQHQSVHPLRRLVTQPPGLWPLEILRAVAFVLSSVTDLAGNTVSNVTATTDASSVRFDSVAPTVDAITIASNNNYDNDNTTSLAKSGDSVTVSFTTSENIQTPTITIAQGTATV